LKGITKATRANKWLRVAIFIVGGLETAAILLLLIVLAGTGQLSSSETLSRSIGWAILSIYGIPYVICVVPALLLAMFNRYLMLAAALCILAVPVALITMYNA
jgi:hypothetical protein